MSSINTKELLAKNPKVKDIADAREIVWINPAYDQDLQKNSPLTPTAIDDAAKRLDRFAPLLMKWFPETKEARGIIESPLLPISTMEKKISAWWKKRFPDHYPETFTGQLLLKMDSHLAIAGSIKARGGIYEVLKHTEELALEEGFLLQEDLTLSPSPAYDLLATQKARDFFSRHKIQVGSTGNLGLSIGMISAAIGYQVIVHMSADAKAWKKDLLRRQGVQVIEYDSDYSKAVQKGRALSDADPTSYFVDDENSQNLFLGYAVAGLRLRKQLEDLSIPVDQDHPLFVYLPCGVGGAPGGVTFGLKTVFGRHVHCFFIEPVQAPCMTLGMVSGLHNAIAVTDLGLTGLTHADGLAVGRPSGFVGSIMENLLSGAMTLEDPYLYDYMRDLLSSENIFIEPSACAAFHGPVMLPSSEMLGYIRARGLESSMSKSTHIAWATGGSLVPPAIRKEYEHTYLS